MKKAILVAIIGAMTLGVNAGDWGKAPVVKAPIEDCVDIGGEISVGYMTDYVFFGGQSAEDSVWADVNYTFDGLAVPITIGAWYLNGINPVNYDELDIYISAALGTFAGFDVSLGYTYYFAPEDAFTNNGEIGLDISRSLGIVDFIAEANYNHDLDAWYYQAGIEKSFGITDSISLVLAAGVGYSDNYFTTTVQNSGWNHYYLTASLPIALNCRATLTPYVGYSGGGDGWIMDTYNPGNGFESDILHCGVSLTVTF